jgi:hypothetical protein
MEELGSALPISGAPYTYLYVFYPFSFLVADVTEKV